MKCPGGFTLNEEFSIEQKEGFSLTRELFDWVESGVTALLSVVLIFVFLGMIISVNGSSMDPTLADGERLITARMFSPPKYKDIIVVMKPDSDNNPLIKRVIATEGQTIDFNMEQGTVIVDGKTLNEPYIAEDMYLYASGMEDRFPMTIPEGHVFVMGDNRNNSWDSRVAEVGPIDMRYIFCRVLYRIVPYDRM
jgi:signal peptidase I